MAYNIFNLFFKHGKTFKEVSGKSEKVIKEMTVPWEETALSTILPRYQLKDIFNADEFGLFYEALTSKSLHFQGKHCSGGKHTKVQLTGMTASNALGEKIPMFYIGKSASPRCFKHICNPCCRYRSQKKAQMHGTLFEEWLHKLHRKFEMQGRKVVMIVDNCPVHSEVLGLKAINLKFLPPSTTSCTQAMDQGIIISYVCFIIFLNSIESQSNLYILLQKVFIV